jgi:NAD(P)-dependent dehydrogenase (short-subunit alcohol dehydrogenase family)
VGTGASVATVVADIGSEPERLAEEAWAALGGLEVVVTNAIPGGSGRPQGDLLSTPEPLWREYYDVIVHGPRRLMRVLAPLLRDGGGGSFVSVVSYTGIRPQPGYDAYGVAKGSLLLLTQYMAKEWGPWGIRANSINPGSIASFDTLEEFTEHARSLGVLDRISLGRVGTPPEVMGTLIYLASDESRYVSGQCLNIDGGRF